MKNIGNLLWLIFRIFYLAFSFGYVATVFYTWFIMPLFPNGVVEITWKEFAGISFFVSCIIRPKIQGLKDEFYEKPSNIRIKILLLPWFLLLGGWIFHLIY